MRLRIRALSLLSLLLTSCSLFGSVKPPEVPKPKVPFVFVAEALSMVTFDWALRSKKMLSKDDELRSRAQTLVDEMLAANPELKKGSTDWTVHMFSGGTDLAAAFPGAGFLIDAGVIGEAAKLFPTDKALERAKAPRNATASQKKKFNKERDEKIALEKRKSEDRVLAVTLSHEILHLSEGHFAMRIQVNAEAAVKLALKFVEEKVAAGNVPRDAKGVLALLKDVSFGPDALIALGSAAGLTVAGETLGSPLILEQELTSDCKGAQLLKLIGSDPEDAVIYWRGKAKKADGLLFKAHPGSEERAQKLRACLPSDDKEPQRLAQRAD